MTTFPKKPGTAPVDAAAPLSPRCIAVQGRILLQRFSAICSRWVTQPPGIPGSRGFFFLQFYLWIGCGSVLAQGTFTFLQTGGGQPLVSQQQTLDTMGIPSPELEFDFGFITGEIPAPGYILDSFTVTIGDDAGDLATLLTIDASGVTWAPFTPGAVPVADSQIQRVSITPPSMAPVNGQGTAYSVDVPVPDQFSGTNLTVYMDLFDNQDATMSLGWSANLRMKPTPEPEVTALAAVALGFVAICRKRRRCT